MDKIDMGSLKYMAPETLSGKNVKIGPSIDLWALGCILYGLLTGTLPFSGNNSSEVRLSILSLNYRLPQGIEFSLDLRDLLSRILILDPAKRIKIGDILSHPWMTKIALHGSFAGREHKQSHKVNIARETTVKFVEGT
jgi:MAP/microtubule affinity-regulating kinase